MLELFVAFFAVGNKTGIALDPAVIDRWNLVKLYW